MVGIVISAKLLLAAQDTIHKGIGDQRVANILIPIHNQASFDHLSGAVEGETGGKRSFAAAERTE